jgi:hypothetical protein
MEFVYLNAVFEENDPLTIYTFLENSASLREKDNFYQLLSIIIDFLLKLDKEMKIASFTLLFTSLSESLIYLIENYPRKDVEIILSAFPEITLNKLLQVYPEKEQILFTYFNQEIADFNVSSFPSSEEAISAILARSVNLLRKSRYMKAVSRKLKEERFLLICDYATSSYSQKEILLSQKILTNEEKILDQQHILYGPLNSSWDDRNQTAKEARMRYHVKDKITSCEECGKDISLLFRRPLLGGGWGNQHYCSWECIQKLQLSDEENYLLRLIISRNS